MEVFNIGMMYQTGIFIITDPSYRRLTVQCSIANATIIKMMPNFQNFTLTFFKNESKIVQHTLLKHRLHVHQIVSPF